jgi:hypothetical protein
MAQKIVKIGVKWDWRWWKAVTWDSRRRRRRRDNTMWIFCITATWW